MANLHQAGTQFGSHVNQKAHLFAIIHDSGFRYHSSSDSVTLQCNNVSTCSD